MVVFLRFEMMIEIYCNFQSNPCSWRWLNIPFYFIFLRRSNLRRDVFYRTSHFTTTSATTMITDRHKPTHQLIVNITDWDGLLLSRLLSRLSSRLFPLGGFVGLECWSCDSDRVPYFLILPSVHFGFLNSPLSLKELNKCLTPLEFIGVQCIYWKIVLY